LAERPPFISGDFDGGRYSYVCRWAEALASGLASARQVRTFTQAFCRANFATSDPYCAPYFPPAFPKSTERNGFSGSRPIANTAPAWDLARTLRADQSQIYKLERSRLDIADYLRICWAIEFAAWNLGLELPNP
jgi:hypothetical protein